MGRSRPNWNAANESLTTDELELRIATLELLALERLALDAPGRLLQMEAAIRAGLGADVDADEGLVPWVERSTAYTSSLPAKR